MANHVANRVLRPSEYRRRGTRYVAALDGLRAFAVLAVIFYHMSLGWAPGGLMGVTVFFVISGYLINGLLIAENDSMGQISLKGFWARRVRRIIPAVIVALGGTLVICALTNPILFSKARADLLPSLFFVNNWWQIVRDVSYFEAASAPSPLTHYWSLAIEEQFYIVWPLLLIALFRMRVPKKGIATIIGALAVASFVEMALLYSPTADPSRMYYGTDTRAGSLLVGALMAIVWPSTIFGHRRTQSTKPGKRLAFNLAGVAAFAGIVVIVGITNSYTAFPYHGGIALVSVLTAVLIAALVVPNTWVARLFQLSPFVWIGKRSYGMYLWHYPVILVTSNLGSTMGVPWWVRVSQLIVIFALSDLSYRFVETPIRSGALGRWWKARRTGSVSPSRPSRHNRKARAYATTITCALLIGGAGIALVTVPEVTSAVPDYLQNSTASSQATSPKPSESSSATPTSTSDASQASSASSASSASAEQASANATSSGSGGESSSSARSSESSKSKDTSSASASSKASSEKSANSSAASKSSKSASSASTGSSAKSSAAPASSSDAAENSDAKASSSASTAASKSGGATSQQSASAAASSGESDSAPQALALAAATVKDRFANMTDEELAQAEEAMKGPLEKAAEEVRHRVEVAEKKAAEKAEKKRLADAYDEIFNTEHLNEGGGIIYEPLLIGDSVSAGCQNEFYKAFPYGHSDAQVNRNIWESPFDFYAASSQVGDYVVFCLGTNNAATDEQIDELLAPVSPDTKVIMVNVRCPRDWEAQTNAAIANAPSRHENIVAVVDWYGLSAGHDEWFYDDGIHLNEQGAKAYIGFIEDAIKESIK